MTGGIQGAELLFILVGLAVMWAIVIWPAGRICRRLGFSPWLGILAVVPVVNLLLLWFVAMAPWPLSASEGGV